MQNLNIPYQIAKDGYSWMLIGVSNDFSKPDSFVYAEYENQYGHIKQFDRQQLISVEKGQINDEGKWLCCPECGCTEYIVSKTPIFDGFRTCKKCGQDWCVHVDYTGCVKSDGSPV